MVFKMKLHEEPFAQVVKGQKCIELRLLNPKRQMLKDNDEIVFTNTADGTQSVHVRITALHKFSSFEELYDSLPLEKCEYDAESIKTAHYTDMGKYYPSQKGFNVVGIEFEIIDREGKTK